MNYNTEKVIELFMKLLETPECLSTTATPHESNAFVDRLISEGIAYLEVTDSNFDWKKADWTHVADAVRNKSIELAQNDPNPFYQLLIAQIGASQN